MNFDWQALHELRSRENLAGRQHTMDAVAEYEKGIAITAPSRKWDKASTSFDPEKGSPAYVREMKSLDERGRLVTKSGHRLKFHLKGSRCSNMHYSKWTWEVRDMMVEGDVFDAKLKQDRCMFCDHEFQNS